MSLEAKIGAKVETAIKTNADNPNLSEVYKDWSNNENKEQNQKERKDINEALHKGGLLTNLTIINMAEVTKDGKKITVVETYDSKKQSLQFRDAENFRNVLTEHQLEPALKNSKVATDKIAEVMSSEEKAVQFLAEDTDTARFGKTEPKVDEKTTSGTDDKEIKDGKESEDKTPKMTGKEYQIQAGDNLWKIAKNELLIGQKEGTVIPAKKIQEYIQQIAAANQNGEGAVKNIDRIYAGKTIILPPGVAPTDANTQTENNNKPDANTNSAETVKNTAATTENSKFSPVANTYYNPTIGATEADLEGAALTKYFEKMKNLDGDKNGKDYVTAREIQTFVEQNIQKAGTDPKAPTSAELAALTRASQHAYRIACTSNDETFWFEDGLTKNDVTGFAAQEKEFEGQYQARHYVANHFNNFAPGKDFVSVETIKTYRDSLKLSPQCADELAAVENLLVQLAKNRFNDDSILRKSDAKQQIKDTISGSSYQEYGGATYKVPLVPSK